VSYRSFTAMLVWSVFIHLPKCWILSLVSSYIYISQDSVEMHLQCGGIYNNRIIANCLQSVPVKKFWKSVNNWRRYGQKWSATFFYEPRSSSRVMQNFGGTQSLSMSVVTLCCSFTVVHRTEVIKKTLNPQWQPFTVKARVLCAGDYDRFYTLVPIFLLSFCLLLIMACSFFTRDSRMLCAS